MGGKKFVLHRKFICTVFGLTTFQIAIVGSGHDVSKQRKEFQSTGID
jgi:hypothetical protein